MQAISGTNCGGYEKMIMAMKRCPFCDKEFFSSAARDLGMPEKLRMHVIEHHHITEQKYYEIMNALELKDSLNKICCNMKDATRELWEKIETFERNETKNSFEKR